MVNIKQNELIEGVKFKTCNQCRLSFPLDGYHKDKWAKGGLSGICKECKKYNRENPKNTNKKADITYRNAEWLYDEYVFQNKTVAEISREIGIKNETIANWLKKHEIPLKTFSESRARVMETNLEYYNFLKNAHVNVFSNYEHGFKGKTHSDETKARISQNRLEYFAIPENRKEQLKHLKNIHNDTNINQKISKSLKEGHARGEIVTWNKNLTCEDDERILGGDKHPLFNNWASREKYGEAFNDKLKQRILNRDGFTCQECGMSAEESKEAFSRTLCIHHIDYVKHNCSDSNLVALCNSCHAKTNFNREEWQEYFTSQE